MRAEPLLTTSHVVMGLAPITPSSSTPDYVTLRDYDRLTVLIQVANGSNPADGNISFKQATDAAGTGEKALKLLQPVSERGHRQ